MGSDEQGKTLLGQGWSKKVSLSLAKTKMRSRYSIKTCGNSAGGVCGGSVKAKTLRLKGAYLA